MMARHVWPWALALLLAGTTAEADPRFHGAWELETVRITSADGEVTPDAYGTGARGMLSYQPSGHMMAMVTRDGRPPRERPRGDATDAEVIEAFNTLIAYAGRWSVDGDTVTHHVDVADWPSRVGTDQVRRFRFEDERLILSVSAAGADGREQHYELTWRRPAAAAGEQVTE